MKYCPAFVVRLLVIFGLSGCAPLTFSHESAIDYERYRAARIAVKSNVHGGYAQAYLAHELARHSGFQRVTTDPRTRADVVLTVEVSVIEETSVDDDGNLEVEFDAAASFVAYDARGLAIDLGSVETTSSTSAEGVEDVLDWIVNRYLKPYRA